MRRRLSSAYRRHPVLGIGFTLAAAVGLVVFSLQGLAWARWQVFACRIDEASSTSPSPTALTTSWSFAFRDRAVRLAVPVSGRELDAAKKIDTSAMFRATGALRARYVARVVVGQSRSALVGSLAGQLRQVKRERLLDSDQYLELLVRAVQSIRFGSVGPRLRLPAEVLASGSGVCSEKALLLAALMTHEGYQTAIWVFDTQNHVAVGVGSDAARFSDSDFAFIETTRLAYIGEYDAGFSARGPMVRPPQFIPIAPGTQYRSGMEVAYILRRLEIARRLEDSLGAESRLLTSTSGGEAASDPASVIREQAARDLVSYIRGQTDDREAVFERLLHSAAELAADQPPALIH